MGWVDEKIEEVATVINSIKNKLDNHGKEE